jgi:hypothetical protein
VVSRDAVIRPGLANMPSPFALTPHASRVRHRASRDTTEWPAALLRRSDHQCGSVVPMFTTVRSQQFDQLGVSVYWPRATNIALIEKGTKLHVRINRGAFWASAAAALTLVTTAGCGAGNSRYVSSGLEHQVSNGERISAASRAHAYQQPAGAVAAPAPVSGRHKVGGAQVTAIGDSVMAASAMALAKELRGIYIDAVPSRQMPAGLSVVRHLAATRRLRPILVMALGTNYIVTTKQLNALLRIIGPRRRLVLVNTYVPDEWSKEVNATEARFARQHPNVVLADWYDTIKNHMNLLWPDHVHPEMPGTSVYARLVYRAVQATTTVSLPGATRGI